MAIVTKPEIIQDLIERILELTESPQSQGFYQQCIQLLGPDPVEEELAEVRYRTKISQIDSPAKYLTTLLKKRVDKISQENAAPAPSEQETYFGSSRIKLFEELNSLSINEEDKNSLKALGIPYAKAFIPWPTFIGPHFFTLSTNQAQSDLIRIKFRTLDGKTTDIPVTRGKTPCTDQGQGILTVEHGRILGALISIWVQQGCKYLSFESGASLCFCNVSFRDVASLLGWRNFGGWQVRHLMQRIMTLKNTPYHFDLSQNQELKSAGLKPFSFYFIKDFGPVSQIGRENIFKITFSDPLSRCLLARRTVSRLREMLLHRHELAFLLRLYLEPILISKNGEPYRIRLARLIENLNLPPASWHAYKSLRCRQFSCAIRDLSGKKTVDGKTIFVYLTESVSQDDTLLAAYLKRS